MLVPVDQFRAFSEAVKQAGLAGAPSTVATGIKGFLRSAQKAPFAQPGSVVSQVAKTTSPAALTPPNIMA